MINFDEYIRSEEVGYDNRTVYYGLVKHEGHYYTTKDWLTYNEAKTDLIKVLKLNGIMAKLS